MPASTAPALILIAVIAFVAISFAVIVVPLISVAVIVLEAISSAVIVLPNICSPLITSAAMTRPSTELSPIFGLVIAHL